MHHITGLVKAPPTHPDFSPALASSHVGLPRACIQICGLDPLRDEGLLYEKLLATQGVDTKLFVYAGVPHGFDLSCPDLPAAQQFARDFREGLRWLLERSV
ncbi:hypothetical protein EW146_g6834 [Bondarzewia mesenterica]|uniref:Alpha/beta hydrolase fold-3 domain-containing protein n=1 Tax=Bondarzewia mesenterica TaxID=1095465 RepID=A0A4S4LPA4_9AGAM|nr:hypothetical protein EW146_g6834 [Bondarzewia mesenterica]